MDVAPNPVITNVPNKRLANAIGGCDLSLAALLSADCLNLRLGQFRSTIAFATRLSVLTRLISHVIRSCTEKQVRRIYASAYITTVQDVHSFRDRFSVFGDPREAMDAHKGAFPSHPAISGIRFYTRPQDATISAQLRPMVESLLQGPNSWTKKSFSHGTRSYRLLGLEPERRYQRRPVRFYTTQTRRYPMFRHIFCVAGVAFSVGGCQNGVINQSAIDQVQQLAIQICGFLPTVLTVSNIVAPGISVIPSQVAQAICNAVRPAPGAPRGVAGPTNAYVGKVKVEGQFVR